MSVKNAVERLGYSCIVTDNKDQIINADKVIFPGVGEASNAMKYLVSNGLDDLIKSLHQPVLGICLGLQLMCNHSEEGDTKCMGIFETEVKLFPAKGIVPHMGWNNISGTKGALFNNFGDEDVYFVHSYFAELCKYTIAECEYILPFSAALQRNNFYATQFHPEKSASAGDVILKNFLELKL